MKKPRSFGRTGFEFTSVGLGTWNMEQDPARSVDALLAGLDAGANHIDTAEMYGDGACEEIVARALSQRPGLRDKIRIVSKVLPSNASRSGTLAACERSLKRLKTDRIDCYLLHWLERDTPVEECLEAFEQLKRQGKILSWGVSNFNVGDMEKVIKLAGPGKMACNQVLYHLNERAIEFEVLPWCKKNGVSVVAYSPLGSGRPPLSPVLTEIAGARGATPAQAALAFLTRDPEVIAIPKSSDKRRAVENVKAAALELSSAEIKKLDAAFPAKKKKNLPTI